jgi:TonB family protein
MSDDTRIRNSCRHLGGWLHRWAVVLSAGLLTAVSPTGAAETTVSGWETSGRDGSCSMWRAFDSASPTWMLLSRDVDGVQFLRVHDSRWKVKRGDPYLVTLSFDDKPGITLQANGAITDGASPLGGITASTEVDWQSNLASASKMVVSLPGAVPASIDLSGAPAALAALDACVEDQRGHDVVALRSGPRVTTSMDLSQADYPESAWAENREGTVTVRLTVDAAGTPASCSVQTSSGHADLDWQGCSLAMERMRFAPAVARSGEPSEGSYQFQIVWRK